LALIGTLNQDGSKYRMDEELPPHFIYRADLCKHYRGRWEGQAAMGEGHPIIMNGLK
jgi:hypothetical protein